MTYFNYINDLLHIEKVAINKIAKAVNTPFYLYSAQTIKHQYQKLFKSFTNISPLICYAVKANSNLSILHLLNQLGAGADCVSEGEIRRALMAGIDNKKIVFSGVGKTTAEIEFALKNNIMQFNIESQAEIYAIDTAARSLSKRAKVALRINPDVEVSTHEKITTGKQGNKFGIDIEHTKEAIMEISKMPNLKLQGLSMHIGSQILDLSTFKASFIKLKYLIDRLGVKIDNINLGGGIGIAYNNETTINLNEYAKLIEEIFKGFNIIIEPGRFIVADSGALITKVIYVKNSEHKNFIIIDAAMNDLARPALYNAHHNIIKVKLNKHNAYINNVDIVGPICESSDIFGNRAEFQQLNQGDLLAILQAGAYGSSMASNYNSRLMLPEILVNQDKFYVIKTRQTYEEMLQNERIINI